MQRIILVVVLLALLGFGVFYLKENSVYWQSSRQIPNEPRKEMEVSAPIDFTARFEIFTKGTRRIFADSKYHNLSSRVYIQNPDPGVVYIKDAGVTWDEFFKTLPMSLNKDCLITGTGQTFCSNESEKLSFILNNLDTSEALDLKIRPNDYLVVRFE